MEDLTQAASVASKFCGQCGNAAQLAARFCAGCGFDMTASQVPVVTAALDEGADESVASDIPMTIGTAWLLYLGAMLLWGGAISIGLGSLAALIYFAAGFVMTRVVQRRLIEFHPMHNTIATVFSVKVWMFLLWPIQMLVLLIKLSANKVL